MKKVVAILVLVLFIVPFVASGVSASQSSVGTKEVTGEVVSISSEKGEVIIKDTSGETVSLKAGPDVDIKTCHQGNTVTAEYNDKGVIIALRVIPKG